VRRHLTVFAVLCLIASSSAWATAQEPDVLLLDGKEEALQTNPLSGYLAKHPNSLPESDVTSSGNWRGYIAKWAIQSNALMLVQVTMTTTESKPGSKDTQFVKRDVTSAIFPGAVPVEAAWYSGALIVPHGDEVEYVHMGYGSTYASYTILSIKAGKVTSRKDLNLRDFRKFRDEKFRVFQKTLEYRTRLNELTRKGEPWTTKTANDFLKSFYAEVYLSQ